MRGARNAPCTFTLARAQLPRGSADGARGARLPVAATRRRSQANLAAARNVRTASCATEGTPSNGSSVLRERGSSFEVGSAFYRAESAVSRDLAVLAGYRTTRTPA